MTEYKPEEAEILIMALAQVLVMNHNPKDIAAIPKDDIPSVIAATASLVSWLGEYITYLALADEPQEESEDVPS